MFDLRSARRPWLPLALLLISSLMSGCCIPSLLGGKEATLYEAEAEDEDTGSPRWYGLLAVDTEEGTRYAKLGPYDGCSAGEEDGGLFKIECFWAGLMNTVRIMEQGGSVVIFNTIQDEGMDGVDEEILETIPLGGASVKAAGLQTLSFDELKAKAEAVGAVEASLPRPDRPNPMTGAKLKYTSVNLLDGKCEWYAHGYTGHSSDDYKCPGFGGYTPVVYEHQDAGLGNPELKGFTVRSLSLFPPGFTESGGEERIRFKYDPKDFPKGDAVNLSNKLIEWRYREVGGQTDTHAVIHRYYGKYDATGKTKLFVARLEGSYGCIVGTTRSNKEARRIADNMNLRCFGPNTVATESGW